MEVLIRLYLAAGNASSEPERERERERVYYIINLFIMV
jgi:hypothetical protein